MAEDPRNIGFVCDEHAPKPDPRYLELPPTYFIGKHVKLAFQTGGAIEHMWVKVQSLCEDDEELVGMLDNDPVDVDYTHGDFVAFNRDVIEDVFWESVQKNPSTLMTDEVLMRGLATFEALRRLGFASDDIYYTMTPPSQGDFFVIILKTQSKQFVVTVGETDRDTFVERWIDAGRWWNNASSAEMDFVWQRWRPPEEIVLALLARGFVFPKSELPQHLRNPHLPL